MNALPDLKCFSVVVIVNKQARFNKSKADFFHIYIYFVKFASSSWSTLDVFFFSVRANITGIFTKCLHAFVVIDIWLSLFTFFASFSFSFGSFLLLLFIRVGDRIQNSRIKVKPLSQIYSVGSEKIRRYLIVASNVASIVGKQ